MLSDEKMINLHIMKRICPNKLIIHSHCRICHAYRRYADRQRIIRHIQHIALKAIYTLIRRIHHYSDTPVVLMVTGSGQQNRDEEVFGHKPFAVIADCLARNGIASLRYDDRGFGQSTRSEEHTCGFPETAVVISQ